MLKVHDRWWGDGRRNALIQRIRDVEKSDGIAIHLWLTFAGRSSIPHEDWLSLYKGEIKDSGLVECDAKEVHIQGAGILFDWVCSKAQAGSLGGTTAASCRKRDARGHFVKVSKQRPSRGQAVAKQVGLLGSNNALIPAETNPISELIATYVTAFQKRYGQNVRPDLRGKVQGQMKTLLKDTPLTRAQNLIQVYLQLDTPWFKTKGHDFITFMENLNPISIALDTGEQSSTSQINWNKIFSTET